MCLCKSMYKMCRQPKKRGRTKKAMSERPREANFNNNEGSAEDMYIMNIIRNGLQSVAKKDAYYRVKIYIFHGMTLFSSSSSLFSQAIKSMDKLIFFYG